MTGENPGTGRRRIIGEKTTLNPIQPPYLHTRVPAEDCANQQRFQHSSSLSVKQASVIVCGGMFVLRVDIYMTTVLFLQKVFLQKVFQKPIPLPFKSETRVSWFSSDSDVIDPFGYKVEISPRDENHDLRLF